MATRKKDPTQASTGEAKEFQVKLQTAIESLANRQPCKMREISAHGPAFKLTSPTGAGLLIHHDTESGGHADGIALQSLTTGMGFSLSRDSARLLGQYLVKWAGPEPQAVVSEWTSAGDAWSLAD